MIQNEITMNQVINTNNLISMENTVNARILLLKEKAGLENQEFALKCKIASGTIWNIQNDGTVSSKTIKAVADGMGANLEWIKTGKGKMYAEPVESASKDPYRDYLVKKLEAEVAEWKAEYQWIKELLNDVRSGVSLGKLKRVKGTALNYGTYGN